MLARPDHADADTGPRNAAPERLCIVSREVKPVDAMIRFVVDPDGGVVADLKRRLPGRGVWVTADRVTLADAVKRGAFKRGFRRDVKVPADLVDRVDERLVAAALDAFSIAHKAGRVAIGFAKVEAAAGEGKAIALVHATEARADGIRKITQALGMADDASREIPQIRAFTSAQLDLALGRSNVVHAALLAGPASDGFLARWRNLERFRASPEGADTALGGRTKLTQDRDRDRERNG
jgi:uncharacterized protein